MADPAKPTSASALAAATLPTWRTLRRELPAWLADNENPPSQWWLVQQAVHAAGREPSLPKPALGLALAAWQRRPYDMRFILMLQGLDKGMQALPSGTHEMFDTLRRSLRPSSDFQDFESALLGPDPSLALDCALKRLDREDQAVTWLSLGFEHCMKAGDNDGVTALLKRFRSCHAGPHLLSLADRLDAEREMYLGTPGRAEEFVRALDRDCWGWWRNAALARLERAKGDEASAARRLARLWRATPWHLNIVLTLHDLLLPPGPGPMRIPKADTAVCIYSWNKAGELARTLSALATTDLGEALVVVLDNGSTDDTRDVLDAASDRFAHGRFTTVRLPVNVGAPAARNWLLSLPEVRQMRAVAFLDDDVEPPRHWLDTLLDAASPSGTGSAGCLVTDARAPRAVQSAEVHLLPREMCTPSFSDLEERIFTSTPTGARDLGLWAYRRACVSVTGCCHLLPRASIESHGVFDVRFTPTQFDDLERDLRCFRDGGHAVFDGRLSVPHRQGSSLRQALSAEAKALVMGNKIKLEHLFGNDDARSMLHRQWDMFLADLEARLAALGPALDDKGL